MRKGVDRPGETHDESASRDEVVIVDIILRHHVWKTYTTD